MVAYRSLKVSEGVWKKLEDAKEELRRREDSGRRYGTSEVLERALRIAKASGWKDTRRVGKEVS